jgi:tetratricopeptide (TPR) repeat protein
MDAPGECYPALLGCGRVLLARNPARKKDEELRQAVSLFNQAISLEPKAAEAYFYRATAYHRLRQLGKAIADFDRAIELDPAHAEAYEHRGDVWRDRGDKRKAEADYARARELRRRQRPRGTSP